MRYQPLPLPAINMIAEEPIRLVSSRIVACDGGSSPFAPSFSFLLFLK